MIKPKLKKEAYLVIVYEEYKKYKLAELFRQVVFSKEQLEIIQNNFDNVRYINLGDDEDE